MPQRFTDMQSCAPLSDETRKLIELAQPSAPFEFLQVNGFIYRGNKSTGEMWRLEANPADKKAQVWKKVADDGDA